MKESEEYRDFLREADEKKKALIQKYGSDIFRK